MMKAFKDSKLTIITPIYKNECTIELLINKITKLATSLFKDYEYIFVNDGSPDNSQNILEKLASKNEKIKIITLIRNFGQHSAIVKGLEFASGDYIFLIDGDLEEDPNDLPIFMDKLNEGFEVVVGKRINNRKNYFKRISAKLYTLFYNLLSDYKIIDNVTNMRLFTKKYGDYLLLFKETPFLGGFTSWLGLPIGLVNVTWKDKARTSSYTFRKLLNHGRTGIIGFSTKILRISLLVGITISILSFLFGFFMIANYFFIGKVLKGFTSIVVLICFLSGLQFISIGLLGEYITEIFLSVKKRPKSIVYKIVNLDKQIDNLGIKKCAE